MNTSNVRIKNFLIIFTLIFLVGLIGFMYYFEINEYKYNSTINNSYIDKKSADNIETCPFDCKENTSCPEVLECIPASNTSKTAANSGGSSSGSGSTSSSTTNPTPGKPSDPVEPYMDSENYKMVWDSVNSGGGRSTSETYVSESTVGEAATGYSNSETYYAHAGYQQQDAMYSISIGSSGDINLGNIGGVTGGLRSGSSVLTVTTDNPNGYTMSAKASTTPALRLDGSNSFTDYTLPGSDPEYTWSVASSAAEFGYSPKGTDIKAFFKDDGASACNTGSSQTAGKCWYPFSTSDVDIASSASANDPGGTNTTLHIQSESKKTLSPGVYSATITLTAIKN